jgi:hypothetical protein
MMRVIQYTDTLCFDEYNGDMSTVLHVVIIVMCTGTLRPLSRDRGGRRRTAKDKRQNTEKKDESKKRKKKAEVTEEAPSTSCPSAIYAEGHQGCEEP